MTSVRLTEIIRTADKKAITRQLRELGYFDCKKHKELRNLLIETLFKGDMEETDIFHDSKFKLNYQGAIVINVNGYEQLEFILVNINGHKNVFPTNLLIWAKEIDNDNV
ncbi:MAG: hypothetical protein J1G05_03670 [Clostridiales bacterium]|nr:hypothetical protein [Clostridiales bacterium]